MPGVAKIEVSWQPSEAPLSPVGVAARDVVATRLAHRLLQESAEVLQRLKGVSARGLLVLLGPEELLPWVNGVIYLGRSEQAPSVLLPTNLKPSVPVSLLESSLSSLPGATAFCALLLNPYTIVPLGEARPVDYTSLLSWLEAER
jgi:hypothetical protein